MTQNTLPPAPHGWRIWKKTQARTWHSPDDWVRPTVEEAKTFAGPISKEPSSREVVVAPETPKDENGNRQPPVKSPITVDFAAMRKKWGPFGGPSTSFVLFGYGGILKQTHAKACQMLAFHAERAGGAAIYAAMKERGINPGAVGIPEPSIWPITSVVPGDDALIDRSRAMVAKQFLESNNSVLLMVDHDIEWSNAEGDSAGYYEGDMNHLAMVADWTQCITGGIVSKKVIGEGIASMVGVDITTPLGSDGVFETPVVGSGMTAYPRAVIQDIYDHVHDWDCRGEVPAPGYVPIFLPNISGHPNAPGKMIVNSEDWALCERGRRLGHRSVLVTRPVTKHWGYYPYEVAKDAAPRQAQEAVQAAVQPVPPPAMGMDHPAVPRRPEPVTFSLCHATRGRPEMALAAREKWLEMASGDHNLEYIFSIDDDDPDPGVHLVINNLPSSFVKVIQGNNRGNVDAYNRAAWASTGQVLVQVHDDLTPPQDWDLLILDAINDVTKPALLHVNDGTAPEVNAEKPWLPTVAILTRAYAERVGGMWHPGYVSVFCDDDLGQKAMLDGVVIEAPGIVFRHDWQGADRDETQKRSYRPENWAHGEQLFLTRKAAGFPDAKWGEVVP